MPDNLISVDEYIGARQAQTKDGDIVVKANRQPSSWDAKARTVRFTMSAEIEDLDKDIIKQEGLAIEQFLKNPVALLMHSSRNFPVGTWEDITKNLGGRPKRTEGTLRLMKEGEEELADRLARHIGAGTIRACSIGFLPKAVKRREPPKEQKDEYGFYGYEILEAELLECSPVTVPANPAALAKMAAEGDVLASETIALVLDTWAKNGAGLIVPRSEFEEAHKQASGNPTSIVLPAHLSEGTRSALKAALEKDEPAEIPVTLKEPPKMLPEEDISLLRRFIDMLKGETPETRAAAQEAAAKAKQEEEERAQAEAEALEHELDELTSRLGAKGLV